METSIYLAVFMAVFGSALTQQYMVSQDGMVAMVTDSAGSPIYAQMAPVAPAVEEPVLVSMVNGDQLIATDAAVDPRFRLAFRSTGNGNSYLTVEPAPLVATYAPAPAPAPLVSAYSTGGVQPAPARFLPTELAEGVSIPQIPGVAGVDYPIFSQALTSAFHCDDQLAAGYYADVEAKCQVFHICEKDVEKFAFLCPNGTVFNEKHSVCDWWYNVRCEKPAAPITNAYAYPTATSAPLVHSYYAPQVVTEAAASDAETLNRLRHQLRVNRLRGNTGGYAQSVEEPAPTPEVAAIEESSSGYQTNGGRKNRLRSNVRARFNRFRNEGASGYQQTVEEAAPAAIEEPVEEVAPVEEHGYQSQVSNGGRKNKLRSNVRFNRFRNEGASGYQQSIEEAPVAIEEPLPEEAPVEQHGYQSNGGRKNRLRSNVRFNRFRNEAASGYQQAIEEAPVAVEEPLPEEVPVEQHGYQSQVSNGGRKHNNRLRSNVRFNAGFRNEGASGYQQSVEEAPVAVEEPLPEVAPVEDHGYQSQSSDAGRKNRLRSNVRVNGGSRTKARFNGLRNGGGYQQPEAVPEVAPEAAVEEAVEPEVVPPAVPAYHGSSSGNGGRRIVNRLRQMIGSGLRFNGLRNGGYAAQPEQPTAEEPEVVAEVAPEVIPEAVPSYAAQNGGRKFRTNGFRQVFRANGNSYGLPPPVEEPQPEVVSEVAAPEETPAAYGPAEGLFRANQFRFSKGNYEAAAVAAPATPGDETVVAVVNGNGDTVAAGNDAAVDSADATVVVLDEGGRTAATIKGKGAFRVNHKGQVRLTHRARSMLRNMMRPQRVFRRNGSARRNVNAFIASSRNFNGRNARFFRRG